MSSLSPELVIEILLWLPVKSLKRFRCLSKTFCTEIDSSYFIKAHLNKSIERKINLKLIVETDKRILPLYATDFDKNNPGLQEATVFENFPINALSLIVKGTCNGLLLIGLKTHSSSRISGFCLWNPFTREYKKLPSFPDQFLANRINACGFGYDSAGDDYKIVIISQFYEDIKRFRVGVYSLRLNSWKTIQDLYSNYPLIIMDGTFVDNALYWQSTNRDNMLKSYEIFGFSLANDEFFKLPLMSNLNLTDSCSVLLDIQLDNRLHIANFSSGGRIRNLEACFWVSGDQGRKEEELVGRWEKAFVLEVNEDDEIVDLLSSKEGGKALLVENRGELFWCNPEKGTRKRFRIKGLPPAEYYILTACCESLVSPR